MYKEIHIKAIREVDSLNHKANLQVLFESLEIARYTILPFYSRISNISLLISDTTLIIVPSTILSPKQEPSSGKAIISNYSLNSKLKKYSFNNFLS